MKPNIIDEKLENKFKYSTEEQVIGRWIDGKQIYRKVISYVPTQTIGEEGKTID